MCLTVLYNCLLFCYFFLFCIAGLASMAQSTFLFAGQSVTDEKWMACKIKLHINPELTQYLLLSLCWEPELLLLSSLHSVPLASQTFDKTTEFIVDRKVRILESSWIASSETGGKRLLDTLSELTTVEHGLNRALAANEVARLTRVFCVALLLLVMM